MNSVDLHLSTKAKNMTLNENQASKGYSEYETTYTKIKTFKSTEYLFMRTYICNTEKNAHLL